MINSKLPVESNIHSRINSRANAVNHARMQGYSHRELKDLFFWSFDNNGQPKHDELFRFEALPNYNNHRGFYN